MRVSEGVDEALDVWLDDGVPVSVPVLVWLHVIVPLGVCVELSDTDWLCVCEGVVVALPVSV